VAISILNWNGWRDTLECLESVRRLDYPNYLTVVVDNGSWDDSAGRIRGWAKQKMPNQAAFVEYTREAASRGGDLDLEAQLDAAESPNRLVFIRNEENMGFTGGNNVAIHYAISRLRPADYVFLLNADSVIKPDALEQAVNAARNADAGVAGTVVMSRDGQRAEFAGSGPVYRLYFVPLGGLDLRTADASTVSPVVCGAGMLIRRDALQSIRDSRGFYLNEDLFCYGEELDLCLRAGKAGVKSILANRAIVLHGRAHTYDASKGVRFHYYFNRNRVIVVRSLLPWYGRAAFHLAYAVLMSRRVVKLAALRHPDAARAAVDGYLDGLKGVKGQWKNHDREARTYAAT
jgi:GT2 family glycosyltransferase